MAPRRSVRSTSAPVPSELKAGAASTAVATGQCARRKAAPLVHEHVVSAASTAHMELASLKAAPPTHNRDFRIARNTAAARSVEGCTANAYNNAYSYVVDSRGSPYAANTAVERRSSASWRVTPRRKGLLRKTRWRSRQMRVWRLHQPTEGSM